MLTLYDLAGAEPDRRFSPYCWRIRMALAHKGLEVETIPWRFTEKDRLAPSGQGRVPVLVDGDALGIGFLDHRQLSRGHATPTARRCSAAAAGRALSRFHATWTDAALQGGLVRLVVLDICGIATRRTAPISARAARSASATRSRRSSADREARLPALRETLTPLRLTLRTQKFLGGETPLYADYAVFGAFQWARAISDFKLLAADDPVCAWRGRMLALYGGLAGNAKGYPV